jgi:hypothetical protein
MLFNEEQIGYDSSQSYSYGFEEAIDLIQSGGANKLKIGQIHTLAIIRI